MISQKKASMFRLFHRLHEIELVASRVAPPGGSQGGAFAWDRELGWGEAKTRL